MSEHNMTDTDNAKDRYAAQRMSIADATAGAAGTEWVPVTVDAFEHVPGPFFHGTHQQLRPGDLLTAGHPSNYQEGRVANNVYFAGLLEPAVWGAELAVKLGGASGRGHVYVVEPTGPFEDDPNVTNKRFPGNVTQSYRTRHPLRVIEELNEWDEHSPEALQAMLDNLQRLRDEGLDLIED